ncbi:MAG: hypothetical protein N3E36_05590 [Sulfolobales archaeon]|nr:hypothetical protein [Sulfolobales archaeon]
MGFVNANAFIYVLIKSLKEDYLTFRNVLKRIEEGEEAIASTAIVQEVIDWLKYNVSGRGERVYNNIKLLYNYEESRDLVD